MSSVHPQVNGDLLIESEGLLYATRVPMSDGAAVQIYRSVIVKRNHALFVNALAYTKGDCVLSYTTDDPEMRFGQAEMEIYKAKEL